MVIPNTLGIWTIPDPVTTSEENCARWWESLSCFSVCRRFAYSSSLRRWYFKGIEVTLFRPIVYQTLDCWTQLVWSSSRCVHSFIALTSRPPVLICPLTPSGATGIRIYNDQFDVVAEYDLGGISGITFVNDVVVTKTAAYFTGAFEQIIYIVSRHRHSSIVRLWCGRCRQQLINRRQQTQ